MAGRTVHDANRHLYARRCVGCGFDGSRLQQRGSAAQCDRCGCDLLKRPPRSYAEMEGLLEPGATLRPGSAARSPQYERDHATVIERWLWFFFLSMVLLFAIAALAISAMPQV